MRRSLEKCYKCGRQQKHYIVILGLVSVIILLLPTKKETLDLPVKSELPVSEKAPAISWSQSTEVSEKFTTGAAIFNSTYLLEKTIKELESDGWIAPKGSPGVLQRLRKMNASMQHKTTPSLTDNKPTGKVFLEADRWKGRKTLIYG